MTEPEREYSEEEIASIFADAAQRSVVPPRGPGRGLTLPELQQIAREVGLAPDAVAQAAARLDSPAVAWRQPATVTRRHFWLPVEAGKTVELPRPLSDQEWTQLVADLRTTFDARGRVTEAVGTREWRGGQARAVLTRTDTGERFQLHATRRQGVVMLWTAVVSFNVAIISFIPPLLGLTDDVNFLRTSMFATIAGFGMVGATARRLREWARLGRQQVDAVIGRLLTAFH